MNKIITFQDLCQENELAYKNFEQLLLGCGPDILLGLISRRHCRVIIGCLVQIWVPHHAKAWKELLSCDDQLTQVKYKILRHGGRQ